MYKTNTVNLYNIHKKEWWCNNAKRVQYKLFAKRCPLNKIVICFFREPSRRGFAISASEGWVNVEKTRSVVAPLN